MAGLEALAGRLASAQAESGGLRQQLEEVRASLPLVQGQNHELNLFRREMREQSDAFRVEVSRSVGRSVGRSVESATGLREGASVQCQGKRTSSWDI